MDEKQTSVLANLSLRKRRIDSDSNNDPEPRTKRAWTTRPTSETAPLTRKNLALFNKMGKNKASDSTDESKSTKTKTTTTITSGFADKAYKNGILLPPHSRQPTNLDDIRRQHVAPRTTASPPESVYKGYANRVAKAGTESTIVFEVGTKLLKEYDDEGYRREFNRSFTNAPQDAGYNNGLSAPQPDFVEGLEKQEFRPFQVADHIPGAALYQDDPYSLTLPHIAGEWKGRGKDMEKAELQAAYDGAAMVYARTQALSYMGKSDPPGHAAITTFATDGTNLNMYAHYAAPSEEDPDILQYHQYLYASTNIKYSYQGYKDGRKGLRNAQDRAREQSYALKDQLKEYWKQQRSIVHPVAEKEPLPAPEEALEEASADEARDFEIIEPNPCQPTPAVPAASRKISHSHASWFDDNDNED
ncbi:hypothetical protein B0T16DRAFT_363724 [Cercophora newfieldiana]|uniref:DUF7924 domain-containing protein n=1 Tax=Cercophora newfieldiana TaxID=92897 RepID=A0AA39YMF8_9PEZI|nr:hypothetical protein B0T16DRAFT_363724 [Cercophora newfieldiana]